ncbi:MAG: hypothetical protein WC276_11340 [Sedimentibacter sp.]|nr:hypothetical protein [Methanolobus sp.]
MKKQTIKNLLVAVAFATATNICFAQTPYDSFAPSKEQKPMLELPDIDIVYRAYNTDSLDQIDYIELDANNLVLSYFDKKDSILNKHQLKPSAFKWWSVDPHAENYYSWSPYHFAANNPILVTDPDGRDWYISNADNATDDPIWLPNNADATAHYGENAFTNLGENMINEVVISANGTNQAGNSYAVPQHLINAKGEWGVTENTSKTEHNPRILEYHATTVDGSTGQPCTTDEAAWCASFVNWNVEQVDLPGNDNQYSANAWSYRFNSNVTEIDRPAVGAIALINNSHVTFVVGVNGNNIHGYGGNQRNQVKVSTYNNPSSVRYFMPNGITPNYNVPTINHNFNTNPNESTR